MGRHVKSYKCTTQLMMFQSLPIPLVISFLLILMLFLYNRGGLEQVMVLMMISGMGLCLLVMANMMELSNRIDYESLASREYDRVHPNYNQTKIMFLNSQTDLGKLVGEIISKTSGLSYWD